MILSGKEILKRKGRDEIKIIPFDIKQLNPNSYNLKLDNKLLTYYNILDMRKENETREIIIPENGLILKPNILYLGTTVEYTESHIVVPMIEGRSGIGRLGIFIHATAGFGDVGFCGKWTLEISVVEPVRIYPFIEIAQIFYHTIEGEYEKYKGKYQYQKGIISSKIFREFRK